MIKKNSLFAEKLKKAFLETDKDFNEILKGAGTAFVVRVVGIVAGYIFTLAVTRSLGAEAWGIYALTLVLLQVSSVVGRLGLDMALLRFTAEHIANEEFGTLKKIYKKSLTLIIPASFLVAIFVYFLSPWLAKAVFKKPYLSPYFKMGSLIVVPFVLLWFHRELIRGLKKIKEYMLLQQTGMSILSSVFFAIGFVFYKSYFLPLIALGVSVLVLAYISIYLWRKYLRDYLSLRDINGDNNPCEGTPSRNGERASYSYILSVSLPMLFSGSLAMIMGWTDTFMLGMFKTTEEVGIYNVALKLAMITSIVLTAVNTIAAPKFAEFWGKKDIDGLVKVARQSTKLIFWLTAPVFLLLFLFPSYALLIFGKEFQRATVSLLLLLVGFLINSLAGSVRLILQMTGYQVFHQNIIFLSAALNVCLNFFLIPYWGMNGAAISSTITMVFWNIVFSFKVKKITGSWIFYPAVYKG